MSNEDNVRTTALAIIRMFWLRSASPQDLHRHGTSMTYSAARKRPTKMFGSLFHAMRVQHSTETRTWTATYHGDCESVEVAPDSITLRTTFAGERMELVLTDDDMDMFCTRWYSSGVDMLVRTLRQLSDTDHARGRAE